MVQLQYSKSRQGTNASIHLQKRIYFAEPDVRDRYPVNPQTSVFPLPFSQLWYAKSYSASSGFALPELVVA